MPEHLILETDSRQVTTVHLNRPEIHNAFNDEVVTELTHTFDELGSRDDVRAVILAGQGKSFSAGADLHWMKRMVDYTAEENERDAMAMAGMFRAIDRCRKPVIARVQGAALGGGSGLVAAADIAVAAQGTKFAFSEVRLGIIPAVISPFVLAKIGAAHARRYFLTGERFGADRAREIGLVQEVVAPEALDEAVQKLVGHILASGPEAVCAAKELVFEVNAALTDDAKDQVTSRRIAERRASDEGQQGMRAFLEKRSAPWLGEEA